MNFEYLFKYIIIGDSNVGKSCIVQRFIEGEFNAELENTIGVEFGAKEIKINNKLVKLQIWDTAGQEAFQSITRSYYRSSAGALVVFDLTNRQPFENCKKWFSEISEHGNQEMVITLVGNKCDLTDKREVSLEEAESLA